MTEFNCPLVTVIIPAYNAGKTLARTIDSILAQDYPSLRIVVCDNSSVDNTAGIVRSYAHKNVEYLLNPVIKSAEDNWNFALENVGEDYIALYHADDLCKPDMLSSQMKEFFDEPSLGAIFTMGSLIDEHDRLLKSRFLEFEKLPESIANQKNLSFPVLFNSILRNSNFIHTPTFVTRKSIMKDVGLFDLNFKSSADLDLWLRISKRYPVRIINRLLHLYRISPTQGSATIFSGRKELPDYFKVMDNHLTDEFFKTEIDPAAVRIYEMKKTLDAVLCAMNFLVEGQVTEAKSLLNRHVNFRGFFLSIYKVRDFLIYLAGCLLLVCTHTGLGKWSGKLVKKSHEFFKKKLSVTLGTT